MCCWRHSNAGKHSSQTKLQNSLSQRHQSMLKKMTLSNGYHGLNNLPATVSKHLLWFWRGLSSHTIFWNSLRTKNVMPEPHLTAVLTPNWRVHLHKGTKTEHLTSRSMWKMKTLQIRDKCHQGGKHCVSAQTQDKPCHLDFVPQLFRQVMQPPQKWQSGNTFTKAEGTM